MNWTAYMKGHEITVSDERLMSFAAMYVGEGDLSSRISRLFWMDTYVLDEEFGVGTHEIVAAVKNLEAGETHNGVKRATQFRKAPLRGLWHKHFFSAQFLPANILLAHGKDGLEKLAREKLDPTVSAAQRHDMIWGFVHEAIEGAANKRGADGRLTGEWLIYLEREGRKYYLCLNTHDAGDQDIYDRIVDHASKDFPAIAAWIAEAAKTMDQAKG